MSVRRAAVILSCVLGAQAAIYYGGASAGVTANTRPWPDFPAEIGAWRQVEDIPMAPEVFEELRPDEQLNRMYQTSTGERANFVVVYYKNQRRGSLPHSPTSCLPGSGWKELSNSKIDFDPGNGKAIKLTRYLIERLGTKAVVLYWFDSPVGPAPTLYGAQLLSVPGLLVHGRSDLAFIRVVAFASKTDIAGAETVAQKFLRDSHSLIEQWRTPL